MLLLVTIVLVLIAAITLLIGIFREILALIFVSIGASALAAIVLVVLSQIGKRKRAEVAEEAGPEPVTAPERATPETAPPPVAAPAAGATAATVGRALPIAGYDDLRVADILPKLNGLDLDELEAVAQHEESTKNRSTILNRIDERMDDLEAAQAEPTAATPEIAEEIEAGEVVPEAGVSAGFPIPDYESRSEREVIELLGDLDADELEEVAEYEETHANRDRVLDAIDDRLDELEGIAPAATPATAAKRAGVKKAAKKAAAKRAPAKKAAAKRAAGTKAAGKKAAATKRAAATKKTTAKKAGAKKAATVKKAAKKRSS